MHVTRAWILLLVATLATACKPQEGPPAPVPEIAPAIPPSATDRLPNAARQQPRPTPAPAIVDPPPNTIPPDLALAEAARARLQEAFGTQGAPLLNVTVAEGVVTITSQPASTATRAQVDAALAALPGATRIDTTALPP